MPHQCTDCGRTFDDGSKEMLSGCPDCGGNKFQFHPDGIEDPPESEDPPDPPEPAVDSSVARTVGNAATAVRDLVGSDSSPPDPPEADSRESAEPSTAEGLAGTPDREGPVGTPGAEEPARTAEDEAQASARSEIVSPDDLPPAADSPSTSSGPPGSTQRTSTSNTSRSRQSVPTGDAAGTHSRTAPSSSDDNGETERQNRPGLSELREELNEQFESIRVLEPGQYELNLMSLYDREEYIIALQEDGKYTIQVPERWEE